MSSPLEFFERCHAQFGDLFTVSLGRRRFVMACSPELVKSIYLADSDVLHAGAAKASVFGPVVGDSSSLVLDGPAHLRRRRLLSGPFRGERMLVFTEFTRSAIEEYLPRWPRDTPFSLHPHLEQISMMAMLRGIFGPDLDPRLPGQFRRLVTEAVGSKLLFVPALQKDLGAWSPWGKIVRVIAETDRLLYAEIARRRESDDSQREDILSMLLGAEDEDGSLTDHQVRDELVTMVVAGYEITSLTLAWAFAAILSHPGVRERIEAEIREVAGDEPINREHLSRFTLLEAALKESMRLNSAVAQGSVRLVRSPFELGGYVLPEGTFVSVNIHLLHHRARSFPNPEDFQPERFLDRNPEPYTWSPFGGGIRRCLGNSLALHQLKVVVATVLQRTRLQLAQTQIKPERRGAFMYPSGGPRVRNYPQEAR